MPCAFPDTWYNSPNNTIQHQLVAYVHFVNLLVNVYVVVSWIIDSIYTSIFYPSFCRLNACNNMIVLLRHLQ